MKTIRQFLAGRAAGTAMRRAKHQIIGLTPLTGEMSRHPTAHAFSVGRTVPGEPGFRLGSAVSSLRAKPRFVDLPVGSCPLPPCAAGAEGGLATRAPHLIHPRRKGTGVFKSTHRGCAPSLPSTVSGLSLFRGNVVDLGVGRWMPRSPVLGNVGGCERPMQRNRL
jgi:hypothetical protein